MRLVSFRPSGEALLRSGIETAAGVADTEHVAELAGFGERDRAALSSTRAAIALGRERLVELGRLAESLTSELQERGALHGRDNVHLGPPVPDPQKIICLGLNYRDHAREAGLATPSVPMFFAKWANSLIGPSDPIVPPRTTKQVDYEAELAVVIGDRVYDVDTDHALDHVVGVMVLNDVSARDLQLANTLWTGGKAIDTFAPCGPALVTLEEIEDIQALPLRTRVNGQVVQDGNTADMIFGVARTVAFLSQIMTLEPGDIIATGTPAGVGMSRTPQLFLDTGDIVEVEIEGVGTLRNEVTEALQGSASFRL
jgi:2-keto-4-pentenoate hydratase/2-oxohepta-3-ene-1,7-dioic acid hydratase in catechol pathway